MKYATYNDQTKLYIGKLWRGYKNSKSWLIFMAPLLVPFIIRLICGESVFDGEEKTKTAIFILMCASLWLGIFNSITSICKERAIIKHEYMQGMDMTAFTSAHLVFQFFVSLLQALILTVLTSVIYFSNLGSALKILGMFITLFLIIYSSDALGILLSSVLKNVEQAMMAMPFVLIVQLVLSGNIPLEGFFVRLLSKFTISNAGYNGLLSVMGFDYHNSGFAATLFPSDANDVSHFLVCWILMILFTGIYAILASKILRNVKKDQR